MQDKEIGIYIDEGVGSGTINTWMGHYKNGLIKKLSVLKAGDFSADTLKKYDCIILPGGSGSKICNTLGQERREVLKEYVRKGGNILGVCAGAYAVSSGYDWSLNLINYQIIDKSNTRRGGGRLDILFTKFGKKRLKIKEKVVEDVYYHNGPIWKIFDSTVESSEILAKFGKGVYEKLDNNSEEILNSPAIVYASYGMGKVIAISPHFEKSKDQGYIIKKCLHFLTKA